MIVGCLLIRFETFWLCRRLGSNAFAYGLQTRMAVRYGIRWIQRTGSRAYFCYNNPSYFAEYRRKTLPVTHTHIHTCGLLQ